MTHLYCLYLIFGIKRRDLNLYTHYRNVGAFLSLDAFAILSYFLYTNS